MSSDDRDVKWVDPTTLSVGPIRNQLTLDQQAKVKQIHTSAFNRTLCGDKLDTLEQCEIEFMRDTHPDREIEVWLGMMARFDEAVAQHPDADRTAVAKQILLSTTEENPVSLVPVSAKTRFRTVWICIVLAVLGLLVAGFFASIAFVPDKQFDAVEWRDPSSVDGSRRRMANRLFAKGELIGKSRIELRSMLGMPHRDSQDSMWLYFLGRHRSFSPLGPSPLCDWLAIDFGDDGRVRGCRIDTSSHCGGSR
jgi:hypothetical protein